MLPSGNRIARPVSSFRALFIAAAALLLGAVSLQAQHVHYGSFHKHSQAQPQTFSGNAKLRAKFAAAKKSSLSLVVGDLNEDGTRDLVSGYAAGAEGVLSVQLGDSNAIAPSTPDAAAAHQRGDFHAPFSATATLTSIPVHPDLLKVADVDGDGHLDAIVAAQGGSTIYLLSGDGLGNFAPAVALAVSGAIASLTTWRAPGAEHDSIVAGLCADADHCFVNIYASDATVLASVAVTGTPSALDVAYLNGTATRDIAILSGTDLVLLDGATALTAPHLENLPVHNAVAIAAGQFVYDRRGLLQLAVLTADGSLHILARPGIDAHALTHAEFLASRRDVLGTHVSRYHVSDPAALGWTDAETLLNVAQIGTGKTILLRGRFTGNGGDGLMIISNGQVTRVSHSAISDGAAEPMMVSSNAVDIEPADDTTAAVVAPVTPSALDGLISFGSSISFQPLISMPPTNNIYFVTTTTDALDSLATSGRCTDHVTQCTLRDAIGLVNQDATSNISSNKMDEIDFIPNGTYTLSFNPGLNINGDPSYHLEIGGPVNIVGNGAANIIIDANNNDKVFSINSGATDSNVLRAYDVFISGVTMLNGRNNNNPSAATPGFDNFGGILDWEASGTGFLTISGSGLSNGNAQWGPGGAIGATNSAAGNGVLELDNCAVTGNQTAEVGGGISMGPGGATILSNTTISGNFAKTTVNTSDTQRIGQGGGLFLSSRGTGAQSSIGGGGSIASNQSTSDGGGIWTGTGVNITGTSITGNTSGGYGGGLFHNTISETTALSGLTFTTNTAATDGGAIAVGSSTTSNTLTMLYSRIHGNIATSGGHKGISVGNGSTGGTATVTRNWWGCNITDNTSNFTGTGCDTGAVLGGGVLTASPYAALSLNITSTTPIYNTTFTATGDLAHDSLGAALGPSNLAAYAGLATTVTIVQHDNTTATFTGSLDSGASAAKSTALTVPGTATANITVDGFTVTKNFTVLAPDLTVTSSHTGNFHPGDVGDTYTLTANNIGTSVTTGSVTIVDTLPAGFTATAMSSSNPNWSCSAVSLTCVNNVDTAAASASFTAITLTVSIGTNVAGSFTNSVVISGQEPAANTANDTGTDTTLVIAPPTAAIVFNPLTTPLGSTSSLQFTLTNPSGNTVALTGVAFSVTLPTGLTVATSSSSPCSGTLTTTAGTGIISLTGATIASGSNCTYSVTVTGATAGIYSVSTGTPSSTNGGTGVAATNAAFTVVTPPTVVTAFGAPTIPLNGSTSLTYTITNPNTTIAFSSLAFTNTLPVGLVVATPNGASSTCNGTLTATAGTGFITLSAGTLAVSTSCTITVNVTGTTAGLKSNSVVVASTQGGNALVSNASVTVVAPPTISKAFGAPTIPLNGSTSLTFTITNSSTSVALTGVGVTDTLPAGLTVATPNGLTGSCGGGTITAAAGSSVIQLAGATIAASGNCSFSVNVTGITAGVQNNVTGTVSSTNGGTGLTASASVTVVAPPTISAAFGTSPIVVNGTSVLTFTVTNPSTTVGLTGIAFSETLPTGLTVATSSSSACSGTITTTASTGISFSGGSLAASGTCNITVTVTGATAGIYTATSGTVSSTNGGTGLTASANLTVAAPATVVTSFGASSIPLNGSTSLTFTITNPNSGVAFTGLAFTDTLPVGLIVATPNGASSNCAGGTLTATAGTGFITLSAGTLAVSTSCAITVNVTGTTAGAKANSVVVSSTQGGNATASNASVTVVAPPTLSYTFGAPTIQLNGTTTATFVIGNPNSTATLSGLSFTDTLPAGLVVAATPGITGTCAGATFTGTAGSNTVVFGAGTLVLAASGSCTVSINVTGTTAGVKSSSVTITSTEGGTATATTANITVVGPPTIAEAFTSPQVAVNGTSPLVFTITDPNATVSLTGIAVSVALPAGLVVGTPNGLVTNGNCGTPSITATAGTTSISFSNGTISNAATCTFTANVTGTTGGVYTVTSSAITSTQGGTGLTASAGFTVANPPATTLSFNLANIPLNGSTVINIAINNPNTTVGLTGVAFTSSLPSGLVVATPNGLTSNCNGTATAVAASSTITLSAGTLAASGNCTVSVNVTGTSAGLKSASATTTSTEGGAGNNFTSSVNVIAPPTLSSSFGASAILVNATTTLTFNITNPNNTSSLSGIGFTDTLPAGLVLGTTPIVGGNCVGTVTATADSNSISLSGGALVAGSPCSIAFNVTGTTAGMKNNVTGAITSNEGGTGATSSSTIQVASTSQAFLATNVGNSVTILVTTVTNTTPTSYAVMTQGAAGLDFTLAATPAPLCTGGGPFICSVPITFAPKAPGLRLGSLQPLNGSAVLQTVFLSGVGNGPVAVFNQNAQATLITPVNLPSGAIFDAAGNYYYVEAGNQRVTKRAPGGTTTTIANTGGGLTTAVTSVAVDGAGTAYIASGTTTVLIVPAGSTCGSLGGCATYTGFTNATGVAVDGAGNLYVADEHSANITVINIATGVKTTLSASPLQTNVYDVAVDAAGNVYTTDYGPSAGGGGTIGKFTGGTGTVAQVATGFSRPYSIRTDPAANLYIVDQTALGIGRLSFLPAGGSTSQPIAVTGTRQPNGVAIDASGTLYVPVTNAALVGSAADSIVTLNRTGATFTVATGTPITTKSATQNATITNIGSAPLVFTSVTPNSVSAVDATDTPLCTGSIAVNGSCNIGAQLAPTVIGPTAGVITVTSNTLASPQLVNISGTAVPNTVKLAFGTAPATPITAGGNAGSAITVLEQDVNSATVTSAADSVALSVTYPDNSVHPLGNATAVNGIATFNLSATALTLSGSYHYTASFGTLTSALATEVVNPAATTHYGVSSATVAVVGISINATVTALDQFGNTTTAYTGTAHITSSDATATLPANYTFVAGDAGVHIFAVQLNTSATQSITATDTVTPSITGSQTGIVVGKRTTATTLAALPVSPVVYGIPVTITATVSPSTAGTVNAGGTIQFADGGTNLSIPVLISGGTAPATFSAPTVGSHSYTASYSGDSNFTASNTAAALSFTVNKAATSVALIASSSNAGTGVPVTFTATVSDASVGSTGTPSGTVQFFNTVNSVTTPLGSAVTLSSNTAVLTISFATVASNSITAVYNGDGNFTTNTSAAVVVSTVTPGYTAVASPSTLNIAQGASGTSVITLTPFGNYTGTATFSCTGLPPFSSCQFIPSTVTFTGNNAVQTVQLTVFTLNAHTASGGSNSPTQNLLWFPAAGMLAGLIAIRRRKLAHTLRPLLMLAIAALALTAITGCGSSGSFVTPTGTTTVTVHVGATGASGTSSGNINQTATITINIQ